MKPSPSYLDRKFEQQINKFSVGNALKAMIDPTFRGAGLEAEVSGELSIRGGVAARGIRVPFEVMTRGLTVGSATGGGHTVATELHSQKFIEMLRPVSIIANLGATHLTGLSGNLAIPRGTGETAAYWVAENTAPTESQASFDQVSMSPKTLAAMTSISRKMMLQSSLDISGFVVADLRAALGQELDRVALTGSGSGNEPTGILNNAAIATTSLGTNGAALTWGNLVDLETAVAQANAEGYGLSYVTTRKVRGKLSTTQKVAVTGADFIWENAPKQMLPGEGVVNGLRALSTTLMPSNITKGSGTNLSTMICGNWSDLVIAQWGAGIDIMVDPYAFATTGAVRIIAMTDVDFTVRHAESFVKIKDIVTT